MPGRQGFAAVKYREQKRIKWRLGLRVKAERALEVSRSIKEKVPDAMKAHPTRI
jgi:hypothetical protein